MFDLRCWQHSLQPLVLLEQGARLFIVPDGVFDGKNRHRLIRGLYAVAIGLLGLSGRQRLIRQLGGPCSLACQQRQGALVQDLPPCMAQLGVDHFAHQAMREAIAARTASPCSLLAQHPTADGLLQGLDAYLHRQLGHLPQTRGAHWVAQHGRRHHQLARCRREPGQACLDHRAHGGR